MNSRFWLLVSLAFSLILLSGCSAEPTSYTYEQLPDFFNAHTDSFAQAATDIKPLENAASMIAVTEHLPISDAANPDAVDGLYCKGTMGGSLVYSELSNENLAELLKSGDILCINLYVIDRSAYEFPIHSDSESIGIYYSPDGIPLYKGDDVSMSEENGVYSYELNASTLYRTEKISEGWYRYEIVSPV